MSSETESELETGKRGNTMKRLWTFIKHKMGWFISFMVLTVFCIDFKSSLIVSQFAFLYNGISRGFCFALCGLISGIKTCSEAVL
jgi:membrane glycosyltransferase